MQLNDQNETIRHIAIDVILSFQMFFSSTKIFKDVVPVLIKEFEQGWKTKENLLLQNCAQAIYFLTHNGFIQEDNIELINKFFNVKINYHTIIGCFEFRGNRFSKYCSQKHLGND